MNNPQCAYIKLLQLINSSISTYYYWRMHELGDEVYGDGEYDGTVVLCGDAVQGL